MINSKKKGKAFERKIANDIKDAGLDKYARRSIMSGAAFEPGDLKTKLPFYIECKHQKQMHVYKYWNQIKKDVPLGSRKKGMVVMRKDGEDILAVLGWYDLLELLSQVYNKDHKE